MSDFNLGFSIDTTALKQASADATKAAADIGKLGDAEESLRKTSEGLSQGQKKVNDAIKDAEAQAQRYIKSLEMESRATREFERSQQTLNKALADGKVGAQTHAAILKQLEEAYRRAQQEAKDFRDGVQESGNGVNGFGAKLQAMSAAIRGASGDLSGLRGTLSGGAGGLAGGLETAGGLLSRFSATLGTAGIAVVGLSAGVLGLGAAYYKAMTYLAPYEDKLGQLEGRLTNSLGSQHAAKKAMDALYESTQKTGLGFDAASDAFARMARNNDAIGMTQAELLQMVDTVQKLGAVSGASSAEMQGGMIQFGQALASGRLQGDELRSIMESFPALAKAIAENFENADGSIGVSIGTLRRMGSEGELTGQKIAAAVLRAQKQTEEEYKKIPQTMEMANQRISDSFNRMLANMGRYFGSSGFVQSIYNFLDTVTNKIGGMFDEAAKQRDKARIAELEQRVATGREVQSGGTVARFGYLPQRALTPQEIAADRAELARLKGPGGNADAEQAQKEARGKLRAQAGAADSIVQENLGDTSTRRQLNANLNSLRTSIRATEQLIAQGGNASDLETLRRSLSDQREAEKNLTEKLKKVGVKGGSGGKGRSSLDTLLDTVEDTIAAISQGGGGGGTAIYDQALSSRRSDAANGRAAALEKYVSALTGKAVQAANQSITQLERQTAATKALAGTIGASSDVIRDQEIAQAAADFRFEHFGKITTPEVERAVKRYTDALRANKLALEANAQAQAVFDARKAATRAWDATAATGNPREQRRLQFESQLEDDMLSRFGDPSKRDAATAARAREYEAQKRSEFAAREAADQIQIADAQARQLKLSQDRLRIAGLSTDEYEIQLRLIQKAAELESRGYKKGDPFYERTMQTEEGNARREQAIDREAQRRRRFVQGWEQTADRVGEILSQSFDDAYTKGIGSASKTFLSGMGNIFKQLGNQLVYEIAIRPVVELTKQLLSLAAQKLIMKLFSNSFTFANGDAFGPQGLQAFAGGGAFTNSIVDRPTLFAFAGGTGLMGEAGPEAIMPLKRGANGKLGVEGGGGRGDTTIIVNDMRSGAGSKPVETQERRGGDGKRVISVFIRDEVRRQIRSGELDREMNTSYGATRTLARK